MNKNVLDQVEDGYFCREQMGRIGRMLDDLDKHNPKKIAVLGASVSRGEGVPKGNDYVSVMSKRWSERLHQEVTPEFINASRSGTLSGNGVFSMWEIVKQKPDLVFLDYSVNDPGDAYLHETFEGIVSNFLKHGIFVVVLLFCNSRGQSTRGAMCRIARHYRIPFLDVGRIVLDQIDKGQFAWEDFATDYVHPSIWGHEFIAEILFQFFDVARNAELEATPYELPKEPCFEGVFQDLTIVDAKEWQQDCFVWQGVFSTLLIEYTQMSEHSDCSVDVFLDGQRVRTIQKYNEFAWNNRVVNLLMEEEKNSRHTIELRPAESAVFTREEVSLFHIKLGVGVLLGAT